MRDNLALREERGAVLKEAKKLSAKGRLSPAERSQFDNLMSRARALKEEIDRAERAMTAGVLGAFGGFDGGGDDDGIDPRDFRGMPQRQHQFKSREERDHHAAFMSFLRLGALHMPPEQRELLIEHRDMGVGNQGGAYPGATSGFFVPVGFVNAIIEALKFYGPLLDADVVDLMDTETGQQLPFPTDDDVNITGERIGEGQQVTSQDVAIGQIMLGAWKYSSKMVKVSIELLQDSAFNLEAYLTRKLAIRIGRALNYDFTLGTGPSFSQPMGILTSTLANGNLVTAVGSSPNDGTTAGANTIGSDDLTNLIHSIDPLYRPNASFMLHDSTLKAILKVKDKFGRPILDPNLQAAAPNTFMGYPLRINNNMPILQSSQSSPPVTVNSVVFGDFKRFIVRRVRQMTLMELRERFSDYGQVAWLGFARYDSSPAFGGTGTVFPFGLLQNTY
ncbi:MAG: phage major capsid protein [Bryobacteraceae bacterium]